jgi:DNA-binding protein HU-beta
MNKSELIDVIAIATRGEVTKGAVTTTVDAMLEIIGAQLVQGERVTLLGFGSFSLGHRAARSAKNPRTGEEMHLPSSNVVNFKPGRPLKDRVNPPQPQRMVGPARKSPMPARKTA